MQNTNIGKTERRHCANSADHHQQISPPSAGFFVPAGTLSNRELFGISGSNTPAHPLFGYSQIGLHYTVFPTNDYQ